MAEDYNVYAFTLLLCTPSELNKLCLNKPFDPAPVLKYLTDELHFSQEVATKLMEHLGKSQLFYHLPLIGALAETLKTMVPLYGGTGTHPPGGVDAEIVRRLTKN
jgi:hypothetical protein